MKQMSKKSLLKLVRIGLYLALLVAANPALSSAQALERAGFGPKPAAIQPIGDAYRQDLGALNPNDGQSFV
jgi:hypothetical protein